MDTIINFKTNEKFSIFSENGKKLLKKYLQSYNELSQQSLQIGGLSFFEEFEGNNEKFIRSFENFGIQSFSGNKQIDQNGNLKNLYNYGNIQSKTIFWQNLQRRF